MTRATTGVAVVLVAEVEFTRSDLEVFRIAGQLSEKELIDFSLLRSTWHKERVCQLSFKEQMVTPDGFSSFTGKNKQTKNIKVCL